MSINHKCNWTNACSSWWLGVAMHSITTALWRRLTTHWITLISQIIVTAMKVNSNSLRSRVTALRHRFLENWINDDKIQCYTPQEIQTCTFSGTKSRSVTHRVEKETFRQRPTCATVQRNTQRNGVVYARQCNSQMCISFWKVSDEGGHSIDKRYAAIWGGNIALNHVFFFPIKDAMGGLVFIYLHVFIIIQKQLVRCLLLFILVYPFLFSKCCELVLCMWRFFCVCGVYLINSTN